MRRKAAAAMFDDPHLLLRVREQLRKEVPLPASDSYDNRNAKRTVSAVISLARDLQTILLGVDTAFAPFVTLATEIISGGGQPVAEFGTMASSWSIFSDRHRIANFSDALANPISVCQSPREFSSLKPPRALPSRPQTIGA